MDTKFKLPLDEIEVNDGEALMVLGGGAPSSVYGGDGGCGCKNGYGCGCGNGKGCGCDNGAGCGCECDCKTTTLAPGTT